MAEHGNGNVIVLKDVTQNTEFMHSNNGGVEYLKANGIAVSSPQFQHNGLSKPATNGLARPVVLPLTSGCQNGIEQQVVALPVNPNVAGFSMHSNSAIGVSNVPVCASEPNAAYAFDPSTAYGNSNMNQIKHLLPTSYQGNFTDEALAHAYGSYTGQHSGIPVHLTEPSTHNRSAVRRGPVGSFRGDSKMQTANNDAQVQLASDANSEMQEQCQTTDDGTLGTARPGYVLNNKGMYVRGLEKHTTDVTLRETFKKFGTIVNCKVHVDPNTQLCRGYGFVEFADERSAQAALQAFAKETHQRVQVSIMRVPAPDTTNVYVRNLPLNMIEHDLDKLFAAHGKVISVRILRHENGTSQGIGFARMSSQAECEQLIANYNGYLLPGSSHPLVVKFADDSSAKRCTLKQRPRANCKPPSPTQDCPQVQMYPQNCTYTTGVQYPQPQPCQMVTAFSQQTYSPNSTVPYNSSTFYSSVPQFIPPETVEVNYSHAMYNQVPNGIYQQPVATVGYQSNDSSLYAPVYTNAHSPGQIMYSTTPQHLQQSPVSSHSMGGSTFCHISIPQLVNASAVH